MKQKFYQAINILLGTVMVLGGIILSFYYLNQKEYMRVFSCISILLTVALPFVIRKTSFKITDLDITIYYLFLFIAHFLGCAVNLYNYVEWFDLFAHCTSGMLVFYIGYIILQRTSNHKESNKLLNFLFFMGLSSFVAVLWEIIEFFGDVFLSTNFQHNLETGVIDTMGDLIICEIGTIIAYLFYQTNLKALQRGKKKNKK